MSEYDETQRFPDMRLARILLERLGKNSLSVSVEVAAEKILDAQHTIAAQAAEITRLLAVEAAAKILAGPDNVRYSPESQDMAAYQCLTCHSSWDKKSDPVHASSCPVLVINPIEVET